MTNAATITDWTWTMTTERDAHAPRARRWLSRATHGKETVWGTYAATPAEAEAALRRRLVESGYAV